MKAYVGQEITIENYTDEIESFFNSILTFDNPEYYKKQRMGKWTGSTSKTLSLIKREENRIIIPFGMLPYIFSHKEIFDEIKNNVELGERFDYHSKISPYDYQEKAICSAINKKQGVIVAPCSSGKTQIGLEISSRIGRKTLWITHTVELLNQSMNRAKSLFELDDKDFGTITGGKIDIGNIITFATVQTMNNIDLEKYKDFWDVIIVDECHHIAGTPTNLMMFYKVISSLSARYKFGLTATPKRNDGLTPCMFALLGPKIYEIDKSEISNTSCKVKVKINKTNFYPKDIRNITNSDGTLNYNFLVNEIINDKERNEQIINDVMNSEGTCMILTDRISHIESIGSILEEKGETNWRKISGSGNSKEERKESINLLNEGKIKILIATYQLAKEGLDVPNLKNIFFATPQKNETIVTQSVGRVARKGENKDMGIVHDYVDNFSMLQGWQKKRLSFYKRLGYDIAFDTQKE